MNDKELLAKLRQVKNLASQATTDEDAREASSKIAQLTRKIRIVKNIGIALSPIEQALELDSDYAERPQLEYLSQRIAQAVQDVEQGQNRMLTVSMPPRSGKSTMTSNYAPLWMLRRNPKWKIGMTSHDESLSTDWARSIRNTIEDTPSLGVALRKDSGAGAKWNTVEGGGMFATGTTGRITGRGFNVLIIDDPISSFTEAHSPHVRDTLWNWWLHVAQLRLEAPYLVLVTMTRWHENDFIGRLQSKDYEGDPADWEDIRLPAISEGPDDLLGRPAGAPLMSPLQDESVEDAKTRWEKTKTNVGSYSFASMYQQRPAPAQGAVFDIGWWKYWTTIPEKATDDGQVVYLDPNTLQQATWLDSWDASFKGGTETSSYVVGQRWVRSQANRYLIAQQRGRWSFTETIRHMEAWSKTNDQYLSPYGQNVHLRLIEEKANGPAIIDTLKDQISGLKPINPRTSKESRARAVTPEIESGNVYLPHPSDPGNEWVQDLLSETRNFPHDANDDQVDTMTQALQELRTTGGGSVTIPGFKDQKKRRQHHNLLHRQRNYVAAARTMPRRTLR